MTRIVFLLASLGILTTFTIFFGPQLEHRHYILISTGLVDKICLLTTCEVIPPAYNWFPAPPTVVAASDSTCVDTKPSTSVPHNHFALVVCVAFVKEFRQLFYPTQPQLPMR